MFLFELIKAIIFGIVEGVTEWLPVSSTGHILLLEALLPLDISEEFAGVFEVVIQLGAVAAVAVKYRESLTPFGKTEVEKRKTFRLWRVTLIGVLPSAVMGLAFDDLIEEFFYTPTVVGVMLLLYGIAFIVAEVLMEKRKRVDTEPCDMDYKKVCATGFFQTLALIPGTSRSGATILGAYLCGASRRSAAELSFLLAIPTMVGACSLRAVKFLIEGNRFTPSELLILAAGTLTAYALSRIVVELLTDFVQKHGFFIFGIYRIILGGVILHIFAKQ